ncbi:putative zinc-binding metallopeptidase [Nocardioides convexus]|nr:putative zinc-binding metallopeptidase [Nocardioides convexus]
MLSSVEENVVIGHADGVITIDLAESDDARRERIRQQTR